MKKRLLYKALFALLILVLNLTLTGQTLAVSPVKQYISGPSSVHFAVIGDYGSAGKAELDVANQVKSWNPDFIVTTGDNNYDSGSASTIDANIGQYYHDFIFPYTGSYGAGAATIVSLILPSVNYAVLAQKADSPWYELRSILTSDYGLANPKGLAYSPDAEAFLVWDQFGAVTGITMYEDLHDTQDLNISVEDFRDIAFNGKTNSLFMLNNKYTQLNEFSVNAKGLPQPGAGPSNKYDLQSLSLQDVQGITFDPNTGFLYLLNKQGTQLVFVRPSAASQYDGTAATR